MEEAQIDAKENIQIYEEAKKTMRMLEGLRKVCIYVYIYLYFI